MQNVQLVSGNLKEKTAWEIYKEKNKATPQDILDPQIIKVKKIGITALVGEYDHFVDEANQMTLSGQGLDNRFTFVLFVEPKVVHKIKKRKNVIIYEYAAPKDEYYESYKFAKSLEFIKSNESILSEYTHLIKTDTDVFLTKYLNDHIFDNKIYFGKGAYSGTDQCIEQTYELAKRFNYGEYKRMFEINSTLLGPTEDIINIMNRSDLLCKDIFYYLCPDANYGAMVADTWTKSLYAGTSTLIATEIVMCSIFDKDKLSITDKIDANCFSHEKIEGIYHVHQWHGEGVYSKFKALDGEYDELNFLDNETISGYCLNIFLKNKKELNSSIFVQIAAYRDSEVTPTILDAIKQASGNHKINFGVHFVYLEESEINIPDLPNVKYSTSKAPENIGLGIGRALAHQFYNKEDYYLQCDSHSRFVKGWDEIAINSVLNYQIQGIEKPILTVYPANYWYTSLTDEAIDRDEIPLGYLSEISFHQNPEQFKSTRIPLQTAMSLNNNNRLVKSVSGGSIFTVGGFLPFNTNIAFYGEEIWLAARAYTHGFDLVVPEEQYMYHLYYNHDKPAEINKRKLLWQDFPTEFNALDLISKALIYKTLTEGTTEEMLLGTERTIAEYGIYAGLDFVNGELVDNCL